MLFHVLNLCSVCYIESMTLPRLSPVVVNPVLTGSCQSIQVWVWDGSLHWFIFSILFSLLKRKLLVGIRGKFGASLWKNTATAHWANQRKPDLVNIYAFTPLIGWVTSCRNELINPMGTTEGAQDLQHRLIFKPSLQHHQHPQPEPVTLQFFIYFRLIFTNR